MHVEQLLATNANDKQYANLIHVASSIPTLQRLKAAVAYATNSGVAELCRLLDTVPAWQGTKKQWLVGIDYCRSDPEALKHLNALPGSELRIHDGDFVVKRAGCSPRISYHPKLYLFLGTGGAAIIVGSGNLSRTGLRSGIEAAASLRCASPAELGPTTLWYKHMWGAATPFGKIATAYEKQYDSLPNRQKPTPVEDDAAPASAGTHGQLTPAQLRQLRVCKHLWIEAGNLHLNRGPGRPGNQLMLKRNMRVYFGFQAEDLRPDTAIGSVAIRYGKKVRPECSLRFSNNSMDVLTLPIPKEEGPDKYDQEVILFTRIGVRRFELMIGKSSDIAKWRKNSKEVDGDFRMSSGRRWGVF